MNRVLVRLIAKFFPMPAKMATLLHDEPDFADSIWLMELTDERQIFLRVRRNLFCKDLNRLMQMQTQFGEEVENLEKRVFFVLLILFICIITFFYSIIRLPQDLDFNQQINIIVAIIFYSSALVLLVLASMMLFMFYCQIAQAEMNLFLIKEELSKRQIQKAVDWHE